MSNSLELVTTLETDEQVLNSFDIHGDQRFKSETCTPPQWWAYLCEKFRIPAPPVNIKVNGRVRAYVNRSRWVANCPYCNTALPVSKVDTRFWCIGCRMIANLGCALQVIYPQDHREIELVLSMRPLAINRNWSPGETVSNLAQENINNGCTAFFTPTSFSKAVVQALRGGK